MLSANKEFLKLSLSGEDFNCLPIGLRLRIINEDKEIKRFCENHYKDVANKLRALHSLMNPKKEGTFKISDLNKIGEEIPLIQEYVKKFLKQKFIWAGLELKLIFNIEKSKVKYVFASGCNSPLILWQHLVLNTEALKRINELADTYLKQRSQNEKKMDDEEIKNFQELIDEWESNSFDDDGEEYRRAQAREMSRQGWKESTEDGGWFFVD